MSEKSRIGAGVVVLLAVLSFPAWYAVGTSSDAAQPELEMPRDSVNCVEDVAFMRPNHMTLLNEWRNAVVRKGERVYTSASGVERVMSLRGTCMGCHTNRERFCTRCHEYSGVEPTCWNCHIEPEGI
jgi:[DsrC]-trisulfide reductase subunit J